MPGVYQMPSSGSEQSGDAVVVSEHHAGHASLSLPGGSPHMNEAELVSPESRRLASLRARP